MATKISKKKLRDVIDCILHNGSYLGKEASKLNVTVEDLKAQIETMYGGGRKNTQFKAILRNSQMNSSRVSSANPGKMQTSAQPKSNTTSAPKSSRATAVPVHNSPEDTTTAVTHTDSTPLLEDILKRKESLEEEFSVSEHVLAEAKEILKVREEILTKTKDVFEQAKAALNKAEKEQNEAQAAVSQAESDGSAKQRIDSNYSAGLRIHCADRAGTIYLAMQWVN